jgi:restriction endonuclease Mrr
MHVDRIVTAKLRAIVSMDVADHGSLIDQVSRQPGYGGRLPRIV